MNICTNQIRALERNLGVMLSPIGCQKHAGHSGMHYYEREIAFATIFGVLAVGWDRRAVWVNTERVYATGWTGETYEPDLIFQEISDGDAIRCNP